MIRTVTGIAAVDLLAVGLATNSVSAKDENAGASTSPGLTRSGAELCRRVAVTGIGQGYDTAVIRLPGQPVSSKKVPKRSWSDWKDKPAAPARLS